MMEGGKGWWKGEGGGGKGEGGHGGLIVIYFWQTGDQDLVICLHPGMTFLEEL